MNEARLPSHLKEIIDKGYKVEQSSTEFLEPETIYHVKENGTHLNRGPGETVSNSRTVVAFCFDGPFLPIRNGASYSLFNLISALGRTREVLPILVLCYRGDDITNYYNQDFKTIFVDPKHYYQHDGATKDIFKKNTVSSVQFCSSEGLLNLGPFVKRLGLKVTFDVQNVDHILEERLGHAAHDIDTAKKLQQDAIKISDYILCRSEIDRGHLLDLGANENTIAVYSGGINPREFTLRTKVPNKNKLVFLAHMYYEPNENALAYMTEFVLPKLKSDYTLTIIGNTPIATIAKYINNKSIIFKQGIDNLSAELIQYDIAVAPILEASGTRLKILDYLASGLPVVTTSIGVEGLVGRIEKVVSIADDAGAIASEIDKIQQNPNHYIRRAKAGRQYVEDNYTYDSHLEPFLKAYDIDIKIQ